MRIISQNRRMSLDFSNCDIFVNNSNIIAGELLLGTYETEERAKEVFTEMHEFYARISIVMKNIDSENAKELMKMFSKDNYVGTVLVSSDADIKQYDNRLYFMPEE